MTYPIRELVLASSNAGKLIELQNLLADFSLRVHAQGALGIDAADEPFPSFVENALMKARRACSKANRPALADDSGICIDALNHKPGVHSARWSEIHGGTTGDSANNLLVNQQLAGQSSSAFFVCALVLLRSPDDPVPIIAVAQWHGHWICHPRGEGGFGYDPHFVPSGSQITAAQMSLSQKNELSHRATAMRLLLSKMICQGLLARKQASSD